jgi:hypothetical protein
VLAFDVEAYDYGWNLIDDDLALLQREHDTLEELGAECNRFLRQLATARSQATFPRAEPTRATRSRAA